MKVILRKRDSTVSIILFIFNIYHEFTGDYSIKLDDLINSLSYFDKNETAARMALSRMVKSGILINKRIKNEVYYELTEPGKDNINLWNLGVSRFFKRYSLRHRQWDSNWYMLIFTDPIRQEQQSLLDGLVESGFRELIKDLFISPYRLSQEERELLGKSVAFLEFSGEIVLTPENRVLLDDLFGLENLKKTYSEFLVLANEVRNKMKNTQVMGEYLPLLFELGWNFYDIAVNDPALPKAYLTDWIGDQAVSEMIDLRNALYNNVTNYFKILLN